MNLKSPAAASDVSATEGEENYHHHHVTDNINNKKTHFDFDDAATARSSVASEELIAQSISSGRRKGKPKKHVREDNQEQEDNADNQNDEDEIEVGEETVDRSKASEGVNNHYNRLLSSSSVASGFSSPPPLSSSLSPTKLSSPNEQQQQHLTVEIPDRLVSSPNREHSISGQKSPPPSPRSCASAASFPSSSPTTTIKTNRGNCSGSVDEYPVMIIRESLEDSRMQVCQYFFIILNFLNYTRR